MKAVSWTLVSAIALIASAAHAQAVDPAQQTTNPTAAARDAEPGVADQTTADDIVVTAERRSTSLQRTGVAATVLTGEDLVRKSVTSVEELQFASPSLTVNTTGQGNNFNIRGIGKAEAGSAFAVGVITYRDGVATLPGYFQREPYYDIASVEVLRGPQGTFAGGNATGGAVFITATIPTLDRVKGYFTGQVGNYDQFKTQGAVNLPLGDTLAIRLAGNIETRDTFYTVTGPWRGNPGDLRSYSGRASLLWEPTPELRVLIKGDYNNVEYGGIPASPAIETDDPLFVESNAFLNGRDEFGRVSANIAYTFDSGLTLRSITGFQRGTTQVDNDGDGTAGVGTLANPQIQGHNFIHEEIWSQEVNIVSPDGGPFTWVLGGFWQDDKITIPEGGLFTDQTPNAFPVSIDVAVVGTNPKTALAAFGQAGYELTEGLQVTVGARWSRTTSRNDAISTTPQVPGFQLAQNDFTANKRVNGKIALNWTVNPEHFFYAFVATGSKAGGLNGPNLLGAPPSAFDAEDVTDYEIGWKGTFLEGRLRTQLGGYYNRFTDFQVIIVDPTTPGLSTISNVSGASELYGAEFSAQGNFDAFQFDVAAGLASSSIGRFFAADARLGTAVRGCNPANGPATARCLDLTGNEQPNAPEFTLSAGAQYAIPIGQDATLTPRLDYSHVASTWATLFQNSARGDRLPARDILNAQLTVTTGPWSFGGFATNLTDQRYVAAINGNRRFAGSPRQYGVRLSRSF